MTIKSIVNDAIRYPFSDWKRVFNIRNSSFDWVIWYIFTRFDGSIVLTTNITTEWVLGIIAFAIVLLTRGYFFRIIKSSLNDDS